ncbi:BCAN [Branchiostoma lanceolatum]|uniref:BCAN protein n=1 Tax=Branchiostoma lanceolatum TaxID=7740 RepID=A0A8J9VCX0_BRALA|nr:BCAN [Branchiostoma lanceolatum]
MSRLSRFVAFLVLLVSTAPGRVNTSAHESSNHQSDISSLMRSFEQMSGRVAEIETQIRTFQTYFDGMNPLLTKMKGIQYQVAQLESLGNTVEELESIINEVVKTQTQQQQDLGVLNASQQAALKHGQDEMRQLSTTVDALKHGQDEMRQLSTTVDALKRDQDDMRQMSATVDALKRDQDDMSTTVDALKRDQDDMRQLSTTVDALKRDQDDMRQLSTTVDALKRDQDDMSTTVDALKRDQDDMRQLFTTVDALKRDQDDMRQLSTTVDALKRDLDKERSRTAALEQRLHEMSKSPAKRCQSGWNEYNNQCYKFVRDEVSWSKAITKCIKYGANLASIADKSENSFIASLISNDVWIGLSRTGKSWNWNDGSHSTYKNWAPGQPDNNFWHGLENCVCMYSTSGRDWASAISGQTWTKGKWNDSNCKKKFHYICKKVKE